MACINLSRNIGIFDEFVSTVYRLNNTRLTHEHRIYLIIRSSQLAVYASHLGTVITVSEFLAEAEYISVDPYQRMKLGKNYPCDMIGGQVAKFV